MLALLGAIPLATTAQSPLVAPTALTSPLPPAPTTAQNVPVEGFVTVRYTVLADGTPADVRAIEFMPPTIDPAPTIATVSSWTFAPGTRDGEAIDWHNTESVVVFREGGATPEDIETFQEGYLAIETILAGDASDLGAALAANQALLSDKAMRLTDIGITLVQSAVIQIGSGNLNAALIPLRMATDPRIPMLSSTELLPALELRMQLESDLGRNADAQLSFARFAQGVGPPNVGAELTQFAQQLQVDAGIKEFLPVKGQIIKDSWRIDASRRYFFFADVVGVVRTIVAECDTRQFELEFNPDIEVQLPDSVGACTIFIYGDPGASFSFVEALPAE
jgi:hypothetical protein